MTLNIAPTAPRSAGRVPAFAALALACVLAGCSRDDIQTHRVPKPPPPVVEAAKGDPHGGGRPHVHYKAPPGWTDAGATRTRVANFSISRDGQAAEIAVMPFPGMGGTDLQFVNLWREQLKLPAATEEEILKFMTRIVVNQQQGKMFDVTGPAPAAAGERQDRIVVAVVPVDGLSWFFKLTGDAALVEKEKPAFMEFLKSVEFADDAHGGPTPAAMPPAGTAAGIPAWELPATWKEQQPPDMILRSFAATGESGKKVDITVSKFSGPAGGVQANADRWRTQVGLGPLDAAELAKLPSFDVAGAKATLVDVAGVSARTGERTRVIGAIVPRSGETWFFKLMGDDAVAELERENFVKFVKSVKFPE